MLSNEDINFWVDSGINFAIVKVECADAILVHCTCIWPIGRVFACVLFNENVKFTFVLSATLVVQI